MPLRHFWSFDTGSISWIHVEPVLEVCFHSLKNLFTGSRSIVTKKIIYFGNIIRIFIISILNAHFQVTQSRMKPTTLTKTCLPGQDHTFLWTSCLFAFICSSYSRFIARGYLFRNACLSSNCVSFFIYIGKNHMLNKIHSEVGAWCFLDMK